MFRNVWLSTFGSDASFVGGAQSAVAATTCENLTMLSLPNATITSAQLVAAGAYVPPAPPARAGGARGGAPPAEAGRAGQPPGRAGRGAQFADLPAFCRVAATMKPSSDSNIKMELWMPAAGWNGKFVVPGNGGFAGAIAPAGLATALRSGYAAATTDTGHEGGSGAFMLDHPERLTDFADRAIHETAAKGKAIVAAFYGSGPEASYFNGCSTGGRQALTAAQRFPDDFDGIVAGAPAIYASQQSAGQIWIWQATHKDEASYLTPAKLRGAARRGGGAVRRAGRREGRRARRSDALHVRSESGAVQGRLTAPNCLTAPQVEAARKIYAGAKNPRTGELIFSPLFPAASWDGPRRPARSRSDTRSMSTGMSCCRMRTGIR